MKRPGSRIAALFGRSTALGEALSLGLAAVAGQVVVFALAPVLTRLFTPEHFGLLGSFTAAVAVLSNVAPLGYDQAIIGAKSRTDALRYLSIAAACGCVVALVAPGLALPLVASMWWTNPHPWFFSLVALATLAAILFSCAQAWYIRHRLVQIAGMGTFANLSSRVLLQVGGGVLALGSLGLVIGEVLGRVIALLAVDRHRILVRAWGVCLRWPRSLLRFGVAKRSFPLAQMPASTMETLLVWLPLPLVTATFGIEWAGLVTLIQRIGTAPAALVGQSVVQIYYQRAAVYIDRDRSRLASYTVRLFAVATLAFLPLWGLVALAGEAGFRLVFGEQWGGAGLVAAIWAPLVLVQIFGQIAGRLLILLERQAVRLLANAALIATMIGVLWAAAQFEVPFPIALGTMIGAMVAINLTWISWTIMVTGRPAEHHALNKPSSTPRAG